MIRDVLRVLAVVSLCACGRVAFDARTDAGGAADGSGDNADAEMADITSGLIAHYPLDESLFANTAADVGPNNLDAGCVAASCPAAMAGHIAGAALFDGTDDRLRIPYNALFGTGSFTFAVWAYPTSASNSRSIVSRPHDVSATANSWQVELPSTQLFRFKIRSASVADDEIVSPAVLSAWQHVAGTWDGATIRLYVNGLETASSAVNDIIFDTNDLFIGADENSDVESNFFEGAIDDVRLYARALTAPQVMALTNM